MLGEKYTKIKMTLCNLTSYYEFIFITTEVPEYQKYQSTKNTGGRVKKDETADLDAFCCQLQEKTTIHIKLCSLLVRDRQRLGQHAAISDFIHHLFLFLCFKRHFFQE